MSTKKSGQNLAGDVDLLYANGNMTIDRVDRSTLHPIFNLHPCIMASSLYKTCPLPLDLVTCKTGAAAVSIIAIHH
jgi:hypothetical protein